MAKHRVQRFSGENLSAAFSSVFLKVLGHAGLALNVYAASDNVATGYSELNNPLKLVAYAQGGTEGTKAAVGRLSDYVEFVTGQTTNFVLALAGFAALSVLGAKAWMNYDRQQSYAGKHRAMEMTGQVIASAEVDFAELGGAVSRAAEHQDNNWFFGEYRPETETPTAKAALSIDLPATLPPSASPAYTPRNTPTPAFA